MGTVIDLRVPADRWKAARVLPLVLTPALLAASTFPGEYRVPIVYWLLAVATTVLFAVGGRYPFELSLTISALALPLFVIEAWGPSELVPYLGAVALVEAVTRRGPRATVIATAAWALAWIVGHWGGHSPTFWRGATLVEACAYVGLPLLLGLYLRGQRQLTASLRARAADADTRARTEERIALARELHDLVAHHMASIVLRVKVARQVLTDPDPRVREVFDDVGDTASGALTDIRRLLAALRDPALGAVPILDAQVVRAEILSAVDRVRQGGFTVHADIAPDLEGLDAIGRLTLLRLVQESLTNVMKYADRTHPVPILLAHNSSGVTLRITNTVAPGASTRAGHGVVGMRERAHLAGGTVTATAHGRDWVVEARLPADLPSARPEVHTEHRRAATTPPVTTVHTDGAAPIPVPPAAVPTPPGHDPVQYSSTSPMPSPDPALSQPVVPLGECEDHPVSYPVRRPS